MPRSIIREAKAWRIVWKSVDGVASFRLWARTAFARPLPERLKRYQSTFQSRDYPPRSCQFAGLDAGKERAKQIVGGAELSLRHRQRVAGTADEALVRRPFATVAPVDADDLRAAALRGEILVQPNGRRVRDSRPPSRGDTYRSPGWREYVLGRVDRSNYVEIQPGVWATPR
jgi:hypothetical protein